jgi:8-oxo-dGTP diphosphatase
MSVTRVVAAVIPGVQPGEFLAFRRAGRLRHGGLWEFPGGKIEPGEVAEEALARELREELGVEVTVGERLWETRIPGDDVFQITFFACVIEGGTPSEWADLPDHDAVRSLRREALGSLAWAPGDIPFVEHLCQGSV